MDPGDDVGGPQAQVQPVQDEAQAQQQQQAPDPPPPRVRRTHTTAVVMNLLKSLPLISILQRNKEIEAQNAARSLKSLNHFMDPVKFPEAGSEAASLISIDPEDHVRLKVPSFLASVRDYVYPSLAKWIADEEIIDREVAAATVSLKRKAGDDKPPLAADAALARRRCMDGSKMVPWVVGVPWTPRFPQSLFDTEDCVAVPLPFFLNKNLRLIISEASTLPTIKSNPKPGETKGISILDVDKLTVRFGAELSLSFSQWSEAAQNMYNFQRERDGDGGDGPHGRWFGDHFDFFNTLEKKDDLYDEWKAAELKFRQEHWATYGEFVPQRYESAFALTEKKSEVMAEVRAMMSAAIPSSKGSSFTREPFGNKNNRGSFNPRSSDRPQSSSSQSFPSGSGRSSSNADCLICGERGHDSRIHNNATSPPKFKDGKPTWAKLVD
jgi:hypothetical protein